MNIYLYTRVSTSNKNQTTDNQLPDLLRYCKHHWPTVTPVIIEEKVSAAKTRPEFERLQQLVREGRVDVVLAWKLDRIARSTSQFFMFCETLHKHRARLVIPSQNIDTGDDSPMGRLMQNLLMTIAEFERGLIQERVKAGLERVKAQGKLIGRRRVVVNRHEIYEMRRAGVSFRVIATTLGLTVGKVQRELKTYEAQITPVQNPTV